MRAAGISFDKHGASTRFSRWQDLLPLSTLLALCLAIYCRVYSFEFFNTDDQLYVFGNTHVTGPLNWSTLKWAFTHSFVLNYDPLTFLAHSLNVRMFQTNPAGHHVMNLALHVLNAALLWLVLSRATGCRGRSFMVAALFAAHPINVENVAWVSELKTLLSTTFFLLALGAYHGYAQRPTRARMLPVAAWYGMSLLAKPQVITFPFVLLLWDYWPLRRIGPAPEGATAGPSRFVQLLKEKTLLFVITLGDVLITSMAEHKGDQPYTFLLRLGNAIFCYVKYVGKAFWPVNLTYMYPHPGYSLRWLPVWISLVFLIAVTAAVWKWRSIGYLPVGWFWFLGTLFPLIGLIQIDAPAMADRYAYVSYIGLFIIACWSFADQAARYRLPKSVVRVLSCGVVLALALLAWRQAGYWKDSFSVWTRAAQVTENNWIAEFNIAGILEDRGMLDESLKHWRTAVQYKPGNVHLNLNTAILEHRMKRYPDAIHHYRAVLALSHDSRLNAEVWANLGHVYGDVGDVEQQRICYRNAQLPPTVRPEPEPADRINWRADWWDDLGPYFRRRLHAWKEQISATFGP